MKRVLLIATGGTIASLPEENGLVPAMTGEELASRVPQLAEVCDLDVVQPMNIDSTNMTMLENVESITRSTEQGMTFSSPPTEK